MDRIYVVVSQTARSEPYNFDTMVITGFGVLVLVLRPGPITFNEGAN